MNSTKMLIIFLIFSLTTLQAQNSYQLSLSSGYYKSKDVKGFSIDGIGINLSISQPITERLYISFTTGYYDFIKNKKIEKIREFAPSYYEVYDYLIPVRLSGKYFIGHSDFNPYLNVEWAVNYLARDIYEPPDIFSSTLALKTTRDKSFHPSLGIGMGALINIDEKINADIMFVGHTGKIINQFVLLQIGISYTF